MGWDLKKQKPWNYEQEASNGAFEVEETYILLAETYLGGYYSYTLTANETGPEEGVFSIWQGYKEQGIENAL